MKRSTKFLVSLILILIILTAADFWLKQSTNVNLFLQLRRLWSGAMHADENCRLAQNPSFPPVYLSAVVMPPFSFGQPLLQLQMLRLQKARYQHFLAADLNSLALAKRALGNSSIITLDYECQSLNDLLEINRIEMQMSYLKRIIRARNQPVNTPSVSFPTSTQNQFFNWQAATDKEMPKNIFSIDKNIYICQAQWQGNNYPGVYVNGQCRLTYGGGVFYAKKFFLLTHQNNVGQWIASVEAAKTKRTPIYGGFENGQALPICRVKANGKMELGKVVSGTFCDVAVANQEVSFSQYEILYPAPNNAN